MRVLRRLFPLLATLGAALVAAGAPAAPENSPMPGPSPRGHTGDIALDNAACESCHSTIAAEWRSSLHKDAFTNAPFREAFAIEPLPFCQGCHAPEVSAVKRDVPAWAKEMGVGCVTCHVVGGKVLAAARPTGDTRPEEAPHPVVRAFEFGREQACAQCHEFEFPDAAIRRTPEKMQLTLSEHHLSAHASEPCASCHMPEVTTAGGRHKSHAFHASRSPDWVRSAVTLRASREGPASVRLVFRPDRAGHAFPTGDLFRRLAVSAWATDGTRETRRTRFLSRHFGEVQERPGILVRKTVSDDRVGATGPAPTTVDLTLGDLAQGRAVRWRVVYQRVSHPRGREERDAAIDGEIVIAEGLLAP